MTSTTKERRECKHGSCARTPTKGYKGYCYLHARATGVIKPRVLASEIVPIIDQAKARGMSYGEIARHTGISRQAIQKLATHERQYVPHETAEKIRTLNPELEPDPYYAEAWPITRRLQALRAIGHQVQDIAQATGFSENTISTLSLGVNKLVRKEVREVILDYYAKHHLDPYVEPNAKITAMGWPKPLDWDNIDNPDETPLSAILAQQEKEAYEQALQTVKITGHTILTQRHIDSAQAIVDFYGTAVEAGKHTPLTATTYRAILGGKRRTIIPFTASTLLKEARRVRISIAATKREAKRRKARAA